MSMTVYSNGHSTAGQVLDIFWRQEELLARLALVAQMSSYERIKYLIQIASGNIIGQGLF